MQTAVVAREILSVCLSVRLSVSPSEHASVWSRTMKIRSCDFQRQVGQSLVSGEVKFIRIFAGDHSYSDSVKVRHSPVTLNDPVQRNGRAVCVISPNSVAFGAYYAKVAEDTRTHSGSEV